MTIKEVKNLPDGTELCVNHFFCMIKETDGLRDYWFRDVFMDWNSLEKNISIELFADGNK